MSDRNGEEKIWMNCWVCLNCNWYQRTIYNKPEKCPECNSSAILEILHAVTKEESEVLGPNYEPSMAEMAFDDFCEGGGGW